MTHLSSPTSNRKFSIATTGAGFCCTFESLSTTCIRSSAAFTPAANPTGWGAILLDCAAIPLKN